METPPENSALNIPATTPARAGAYSGASRIRGQSATRGLGERAFVDTRDRIPLRSGRR